MLLEEILNVYEGPSGLNIKKNSEMYEKKDLTSVCKVVSVKGNELSTIDLKVYTKSILNKVYDIKKKAYNKKIKHQKGKKW